MRQQTGSIHALQPALWDRLLNLQPTFFRRYTSRDLQTRMGAITTIHKKLSGATLRTLVSSGLALLNLALMLYYHVPLALVASAVALLSILVITHAGVSKLHQLRPLQEGKGELAGVMVQLINGIAKLRIAGAEGRVFAHWGQLFSHQQKRRHQIQRLDDRVAVFHSVSQPLTAVVMFWYVIQIGPADAISGDRVLTAGTFLAFHADLGVFMSGFTNLNTSILDVLDIITYWEHTRPILQSDLEVNPHQTDPGCLSGKLALEHITCRYQPNDPVILNDVSLRVEAGEFVALVGPSGSGKSTIFRLLVDFETPQSGAVFYDDQELTHLDNGAVRRQMGTVLQQTRLMSGSIFDNLAGGVSIEADHPPRHRSPPQYGAKR